MNLTNPQVFLLNHHAVNFTPKTNHVLLLYMREMFSFNLGHCAAGLGKTNIKVSAESGCESIEWQ